MYELGDLILRHGLVYEVQPWVSCRECSFGYDDEQECLAPYLVCKTDYEDSCQFKFVREATDREVMDNADWDVINKTDDEQLIML